jgi:molecular chaperone DnaK
MVADNKSLGRFVLDGIPPAPRGVPQVEVTFNLDANGILNVTAKDKGSGKEQSITIQGSSGLSKDEVEKMAKEAEAHAEEDKKKRESIDARNVLDTAVYQAEKLKTDSKDKLSEDDVKAIDTAVEEAKKALSNDKAGKEELEKAAKDLSDKLMPIGAKMYEQASKDEAKPEDSDKPSDDKKDGPVEGEVVDDKEK